MTSRIHFDDDGKYERYMGDSRAPTACSVGVSLFPIASELASSTRRYRRSSGIFAASFRSPARQRAVGEMAELVHSEQPAAKHEPPR